MEQENHVMELLQNPDHDIEGGSKVDQDAKGHLELELRELLAFAVADFGFGGLEYIVKQSRDHILKLKNGEIPDLDEWILELNDDDVD